MAVFQCFDVNMIPLYAMVFNPKLVYISYKNHRIMGEVRYNSLMLKAPERAEKLFEKSEKVAMDRYKKLIRQQKSFDEQ